MGYPEQPGVRCELLMPNGNGTIEFCKMVLSLNNTSSVKAGIPVPGHMVSIDT